MKWENLNLHLENLLPGLVCFILVSLLLPSTFINHFEVDPARTILGNEFMGAGIFVATAYMLGALSFIIGHLMVDRLSERFPRPWLLRAYSRGQLAGMTSRAINEEYRAKMKTALSGTNKDIKKEILKRRQRGRLVRVALVPVLLSVFVVTTDHPFWMRGMLFLGAWAIFLVLYAYAEVTIYFECLLA